VHREKTAMEAALELIINCKSDLVRLCILQVINISLHTHKTSTQTGISFYASKSSFIRKKTFNGSSFNPLYPILEAYHIIILALLYANIGKYSVIENIEYQTQNCI
jgi:hypothetical protein